MKSRSRSFDEISINQGSLNSEHGVECYKLNATVSHDPSSCNCKLAHITILVTVVHNLPMALSPHSTSCGLRDLGCRGLCYELVEEIICLSLIGLRHHPSMLDSDHCLHWIALYHTCHLFQSILHHHPNPFQEFVICFSQPTQQGGKLTMSNRAMKRLVNWEKIICNLSMPPANSSPISLGIHMEGDCRAVLDTKTITAIFSSLEKLGVSNILDDMQVQIMLPHITHSSCPPFAILKALHVTVQTWFVDPAENRQSTTGTSEGNKQCILSAPRLEFL